MKNVLSHLVVLFLSLGAALSAQAAENIYADALSKCQAGKVNVDAAVRDFLLIKDQSVDTWLAMMGDAQTAADMIRTRGIGPQLYQNLTSPEYLKAVQDCFPNSPSHQWIYIVSDIGLAYEGVVAGSGLVVLTFYAPEMLLNALSSATPLLPVAAQAAWLRGISVLRHGLYGFAIYVAYELVMAGREIYLNYRDPARPVLITMQKSLLTAVYKERDRIRAKIYLEQRQTRRKIMSLRYSEEQVQGMRQRLRNLNEALFKLEEV